MFENDFEKIAKSLESHTLRRGGPLDQKISVPCKSCAKVAEVTIRRFTHKKPPRCGECGIYLDKEKARRIITDRLLILLKRGKEIIDLGHK